MTAEKKESNKTKNERSTIIVVLAVIVLVVGIIIAIPIVYATGRNSGNVDTASLTNVSDTYTNNECTTSLTIDAYHYYGNAEPFPFKYHNVLYRPGVVVKEITLLFGFNHNDKSWSIDKINVTDTTTATETLNDGDFESNYLTKYYKRCILSNTRTSTGDTLFDNPYSGDFYYNDQTFVGMAYLTQQINVIGGRYYNISYFLENRGYNNTYVFLIGYVKNK